MDRADPSIDGQEHSISDANQLKRQIAKVDKEKQLISKGSVGYQNTAKKVLQHLENDSTYYVSHLKDIEHTEKKKAKEKLIKEENVKAVDEIQMKLKASKNEHESLIMMQKELVKDNTKIDVKPRLFETEKKDSDISFEKYTTRYNNYHSVNAFLRNKISGLVKQKTLFEDQNHRYESELKSLKLRISQAIDNCNQNYEIREELKMKAVQLMEKNDKENAAFNTEMLEIDRLIKEKQEQRIFKENKQETRGFVQIETQSKSDLKKEKNVQVLKELEEFVGYLETFKDFRNSFVSSYLLKEREIKSLYEYICEEYSNSVPEKHENTKLSESNPVKFAISQRKPLFKPVVPVLLNEEAESGLAACAALLNLDVSLDSEMNVDYYTINRINPENYYTEIDYELDKLTLLAALKKAVLDTSDDVLGSLRHNNSVSTLSSEKPNGAKERLMIVNPVLLEPPHFQHKQFPSVE
eukprot:NODE_300_length_11422_cov_0.297978.p2 type:complete len:467 gc:universal NODE_300_length_11422_cov_0.297978:11164-9764(-)